MRVRCKATIYEKEPNRKRAYWRRRCRRDALNEDGYCRQHAKQAMQQGKIKQRII